MSAFFVLMKSTASVFGTNKWNWTEKYFVCKFTGFHECVLKYLRERCRKSVDLKWDWTVVVSLAIENLKVAKKWFSLLGKYIIWDWPDNLLNQLYHAFLSFFKWKNIILLSVCKYFKEHSNAFCTICFYVRILLFSIAILRKYFIGFAQL